MTLLKLPKEKFGELLQALYDCEIHFRFHWMWDGGFDWSFTDGFTDSPDETWSDATKNLDVLDVARDRRWDTDIEVQGGLIIREYLEKYDGLDSEGQPNPMHRFLSENGFANLTDYGNVIKPTT